jgi:hypothetical protein
MSKPIRAQAYHAIARGQLVQDPSLEEKVLLLRLTTYMC